MFSVKMKRSGNVRNIVATLCLIGLVLVSVEGAAEDYTATSLLAEKEAEINGFVSTVEANARNCDALKTCSSSTSCSRLSCNEYGVQGDPNYKCQGVASNPTCGIDCKQRNFDYTRSFIRRVDSYDPNIAQTVCSQRTLDDQFKRSSIGDSNYLFRVFYGSVDGTSRLYPGLDEDCGTSAYDCRIRPWFKESLNVPKGVTILIDSGRRMRDRLTGAKNDQETYLSKEINAALAFLPTLREDTDYVAIQSFDGNGIIPTTKSQRYSSDLYQSFASSLYGVVNGSVAENPTLASTNSAIRAAITELTVATSPVPPDYLKMVLVFTGGEQYLNLSELDIPGNSSVNVFVYNFLTTSKLPECNPGVRASSEAVPATRYDNPLLFLESAFSFLGKIHQSFMKTPDFGQRYADSSGVDNSTLTLSKAAFGPNGELLGVVGLDFFQLKVEEQYPNINFEDIVIAARSKPNFKFDPNALTTSVCFNHTAVCPGAQTDIQGFLCGVKTGDKNIGCCGKCTKKHDHKLVKILGSVIGSLAVLALVFCCYWIWNRNRTSFKPVR